MKALKSYRRKVDRPWTAAISGTRITIYRDWLNLTVRLGYEKLKNELQKWVKNLNRIFIDRRAGDYRLIFNF